MQFQDVHPDALREILDMGPKRLKTVLAHLKSRLMIVREDKRPAWSALAPVSGCT